MCHPSILTIALPSNPLVEFIVVPEENHNIFRDSIRLIRVCLIREYRVRRGMKRARNPSGFLGGEYPLDEYSIFEREHRPCASSKDSLSTGAFRRQNVSKIPARAVNAAVRAALPKGRTELKAEADQLSKSQPNCLDAMQRSTEWCSPGSPSFV